MKIDYEKLQRGYQAPVRREGTTQITGDGERITIVAPRPLIREIRAQDKASDYDLVDVSSGHDDYGYTYEIRKGDTVILKSTTIWFHDGRGTLRFDVGFDSREVDALELTPTENPPVDYKAYRARLGLTQQDVADILGIPRRTWQDWEFGRRTPPDWVERLLVDKLERMAGESAERV